MMPFSKFEKDSIWIWLGMTYEKYNRKIFEDPERICCAVKKCRKRNVKGTVLCEAHLQEFHTWQKTPNKSGMCNK